MEEKKNENELFLMEKHLNYIINLDKVKYFILKKERRKYI
jgi:hypothetical protein